MSGLEHSSTADLQKTLKATCDAGESSIAVCIASAATGVAVYDTIFVIPCIAGAGVSLIVNIYMERRLNSIIKILCPRISPKY